MYEPDDDGGKADVPDPRGSYSSDGEPDAVKVARPVRKGVEGKVLRLSE
jgi:hypothetical protein